MARREELGHPLGTVSPPPEPEPVTIQPEASTSGRTDNSANFVLEIGSEELPPDDVMTAVQQLRFGHKLLPIAQATPCDVIRIVSGCV